MNSLNRMFLAGMMLAAATSPRAHGASMYPAGTLSAATVVLTSAQPRPAAPAPTTPIETEAPRPARVRAHIVISEAQLAEARDWIASELTRFGRDESFARDAASLLTPDDLAVLAANPKMMQPAGDLTARQENLLWATLIIGGIVLLIIAADSSSVTITA